MSVRSSGDTRFLRTLCACVHSYSICIIILIQHSAQHHWSISIIPYFEPLFIPCFWYGLPAWTKCQCSIRQSQKHVLLLVISHPGFTTAWCHDTALLIFSFVLVQNTPSLSTIQRVSFDVGRPIWFQERYGAFGSLLAGNQAFQRWFSTQEITNSFMFSGTFLSCRLFNFHLKTYTCIH